MCGSELTGLQRKWCSKRCKNRWRRTVPTRELVCAGCGTVVLVPPARLYKRTIAANIAELPTTTPSICEARGTGGGGVGKSSAMEPIGSASSKRSASATKSVGPVERRPNKTAGPSTFTTSTPIDSRGITRSITCLPCAGPATCAPTITEDAARPGSPAPNSSNCAP